jgi:hypothetical protein
MTSSLQRKLVALLTTMLVAAGVTLVAAPGAHAAKADLVWYFDRTFREVIDIGATGDSHGDVTVTHGNVTEVAGGAAVGAYVTSQLTAFIAIPGGRQSRKTDISIKMGKGVIYTTALVEANAGTPPTKTTAHAIIGGTGKYSGVSGEIILKPLSATRYKVSFFFVN